MIIDLNEETRAIYLELILKCDPCVGDTACQIRAIIFLDFYRILSNPAIFQMLSQANKNSIAQFIEDAIFLTTYTDTKFFEPPYNLILNNIPPNVFLQLKQNPELTEILEHVHAENYRTYPFTYEHFSQIKKVISESKELKKYDEKIEFSELDMSQESVVFLNHYLSLSAQEPLQKINRVKCLFMEKKQYLANYGFHHLQNIARGMQFSNNYQKYINNPFLIYNFFTKKNKKEKIQMIPTFISTSIMLYHLKKTSGILELTLLVNETIEPIVLYYQFQDNEFKIIPSFNDPIAIRIKMDIHRKNEISPNVEACFSQMDTSTFLSDFKKIPIDKLILMCAAAHAPAPAKIKIENNEVFHQDFPDIPIRNCPSLSDIHIDLTECLFENYKNLNILAKFYGLSHQMRRNESPIVNIRHIHVGSATPTNTLNEIMNYPRSAI